MDEMSGIKATKDLLDRVKTVSKNLLPFSLFMS